MATTANSVRTAAASAPEAKPYTTRTMLSNAMIITRREVFDSFRDWRIVMPIIVLTFLFPFLATNVAQRFSNFVADYGAEIIGERTIPFLLMIIGFFPISISLVIALETFVGEKERRSLEPLLSTPLTNTELYVGKTVAAMIPPLIASYGGMAVYLLMLLFGELAWRPQPVLIIQIVLLTTVQALVMVTGAVVVSSQANSTRAANLLASFIIIPMSIAIQAESFVMFIAPDADSPTGIFSLWMIILGMTVAVILLLRVGNSIFNREELLGSTVDQMNLRGTFKRIWQWFRAVDADGNTAKNPWQWYTQAILYSVRNSWTAIRITSAWFVIMVIVGFIIGQQPGYQLPLPPQEELFEEAGFIVNFFDFTLQGRAATFIFIQNARILLAAWLLAIFSFGVMSLVLTPATFVILGYLWSQLMANGYDMGFFYGGILTHGVIEIPAIVLATAAALRIGTVITRPPAGRTVGAAWMNALGDSLKIGIGLVLPMLIAAALIEAYLTPRVLLYFLGGA